MNAPIGIIGAMQVEVELLQQHMTNITTKTISSMTFYCGELAGARVVVAQSGVGKVNAAMCAQVMATIFSVGACINTGIAGSLAHDLHVGDIVISTDAVYHDVDVTNLSYKPGQLPDLDTLAFSADTALRECAYGVCSRYAAEHGKRCIMGRIASGDQFVCTQARKEAIVQEFGAACCEMEGAAIGHVCYRNQVPFVGIRTMSDSADEVSKLDYPSFERTCAYANAACIEDMLRVLNGDGVE